MVCPKDIIYYIYGENVRWTAKNLICRNVDKKLHDNISKTSLALYAYIYRPIMDNIDHLERLHIVYISLEMKAEILFAKLLSTYIFETYGKEISYKEMLSKTRNTLLSDEDYQLILDSREWLEKVESVLTIYDKSLNANIFSKILKKVADANGSFIESDNRKIYQPNDPDKVILVVIDHLAFVIGAYSRNTI